MIFIFNKRTLISALLSKLTIPICKPRITITVSANYTFSLNMDRVKCSAVQNRQSVANSKIIRFKDWNSSHKDKIFTIHTQIWTGSKLSNVNDFDSKLISWLTMNTSSKNAMWPSGEKHKQNIYSEIINLQSTQVKRK